MTTARLVFGLMISLVLMAPAAAALGAEHGGQSSGGLSPLPLTWDEIRADLAVWTAVVFLVLLAVLWKFAWGPLARGLEKREQGIADQIAQAEQSNLKAQELLRQYEQKLTASKEEVRGILEKARRDAEQLGNEMLQRARQEAQAEQRRALRQIDMATANALKELAQHSSNLAVELAGKILRAELKPEDHSRLIQEAVSSFGRGQSPNGGARSR